MQHMFSIVGEVTTLWRYTNMLIIIIIIIMILANSLLSDARHSSSRGGRLGDTNQLR